MKHRSGAIFSFALSAHLLMTFGGMASAGEKVTAKVTKTGCNCGSSASGGIVVSSPGISDFGHAGPAEFAGPTPAPYAEGEGYGPIPPGGYGPGPVPAGPGPVGGPLGSVNPNTNGPPPGTVGITYRRPSRLIPTDKHPRIAMLEVSVEDAYDVWVDGMKAYRAKDGIWRLETKEPLIPGVPHIYHVKATLGDGEDAPVEYRTVRLIPGRIVDLQW